MQLSQSIKLRQKQSLVMTPQLQQAIKLLQMSNIELSQHLQEQMYENPFLEVKTIDDRESERQRAMSLFPIIRLPLLRVQAVLQKLDRICRHPSRKMIYLH